MITLAEYAGRAVAVFGLGKAGGAAVAALLAGGAQVFAWDDGEASREALRKQYGARVQLLPIAQWPWERLALLALAPGVPLSHPVARLARQAECPVTGEVELLFRACPRARYVAITGTNGKSTTTTLIAHILHEAGLRAEVGGNLGTPALALSPLEEDGVYVLELSSYQLELLHSTRFNVAVFLNVTPDHLDRHGDMAGYVRAKMHIFDRQRVGDVAVVAVDDDYTRAIAAQLKERPAQVVEVSTSPSPAGGESEWGHSSAVAEQSPPSSFAKASEDRPNLPPAGGGIIVHNAVLHDGAATYDLRAIPTLTGRHNGQNAACAWAAARACGVEAQTIYNAMQSFPGLAHRLELIDTLGGVRFINDSKATNADATLNALAPFEHIYWILGGKAKEGGIETLAPYFPRIAHAFLIGDAANAFAHTLEGKAPYTQCGTLDVAVARAAALAQAEGKPGAVVLLSPACASFDQFRNFEERGECFRQLVKEGCLLHPKAHAS